MINKQMKIQSTTFFSQTRVMDATESGITMDEDDGFSIKYYLIYS
jgi:hypothetical protein